MLEINISFEEACANARYADYGIDEPRRGIIGVGKGEKYIPPLNIYQTGKDQSGNILWRIKDGTVNGITPTYNGSQIGANGAEFTVNCPAYVYVRISSVGTCEILSGESIPSDTASMGYIALAYIDDDGNEKNYLNSSIRTYNCGSEWLHYAV